MSLLFHGSNPIEEMLIYKHLNGGNEFFYQLICPANHLLFSHISMSSKSGSGKRRIAATPVNCPNCSPETCIDENT